MILRFAFRFLVFALASFCATSVSAHAECTGIDSDLIRAQTSLRAAEPARDATQDDFVRRLGLVASAFDDAAAAETIRTTTPGGCGNIQQVYDQMLTVAWAEILLGYLKPSLDFYVSDPACKAISALQTQDMIYKADETMNRSLIAWNPFDQRLVVNRDHVTRLVDEAAAYLRIGLPAPDRAEDYARQSSYLLQIARTKHSVDCVTTVTNPRLPRAILQLIFPRA